VQTVAVSGSYECKVGENRHITTTAVSEEIADIDAKATFNYIIDIHRIKA